MRNYEQSYRDHREEEISIASTQKEVVTVQDDLTRLAKNVQSTTDPDDPKKTKKKLSVTTGFNSLETSVTNQGDARIRNFADVGLTYRFGDESLSMGYHGLNEFSQSLKTYFGRHVLSLGLNDVKLKPIGVIKTTADGVVSNQYGLRYLVSNKLGVDYGWIDVTANKGGSNVSFFLGKTLGKAGKASVETMSSLDVTHRKVNPYTELQLNKEISKGFNVFVRGETPWLSFDKNTYLLGVSKAF